MIVEIKVDEETSHRINFDDWSPAQWAIFEDEYGCDWLTWNPLRSAGDADRLIRYATKLFKFDPAVLDTRSKFLAKVSYAAADDLPEEYENGVPLEADDPSMDSSSTSSASTAGLPTSSEDNPSET